MNMIVLILFFIIGWSALWFCISVLAKRNDIADTAWGLFPIALFGVIYIHEDVVSPLFWITFCTICIWGLRLAFYIGERTLQKKAEDPRYKKWRDEWKWFYTRSFFQVFLLQSVLASIIALPLVFSFYQTEFSVIHILGICIFCFGFIFEAIGDFQLAQFLETKKKSLTDKTIMDLGLWKYTRHPNYFGEVVLWWGIFLISFDVSYWYFTLFSPLLITVLIVKVSGIPMSETRYAGNKEWEEYKKKTSVFFPLPAKTQ